MNLAQANSITAVIACAVTDRYHRRGRPPHSRDCGGCRGPVHRAGETHGQGQGSLGSGGRVRHPAPSSPTTPPSRPAPGRVRRTRALQQAVRHVTEALGTLLENHAVRFALQLLLEIAATGHPEALSSEVAENIRARVGPGVTLIRRQSRCCSPVPRTSFGSSSHGLIDNDIRHRDGLGQPDYLPACGIGSPRRTTGRARTRPGPSRCTPCRTSVPDSCGW